MTIYNFLKLTIVIPLAMIIGFDLNMVCMLCVQILHTYKLAQSKNIQNMLWFTLQIVPNYCGGPWHYMIVNFVVKFLPHKESRTTNRRTQKVTMVCPKVTIKAWGYDIRGDSSINLISIHNLNSSTRFNHIIIEISLSLTTSVNLLSMLHR